MDTGCLNIFLCLKGEKVSPGLIQGGSIPLNGSPVQPHRKITGAYQKHNKMKNLFTCPKQQKQTAWLEDTKLHEITRAISKVLIHN